MAKQSHRKHKRKSKAVKKQRNVHKKRKIPWFWLTLLVILVLAFVVSKLELDFSDKRPKKAFEPPKKEFTHEGYLSFHKKASSEPFKTIYLEIAETDYERSLGLMFRYEMADSLGMLFIMASNEEQSFWMRNTYINLDILYVDEDFKIVSQHKQVQALSDQSVASGSDAKYVVEVVGGFSDRYGVSLGDSISFQRLSPSTK